MKPLLWSITLLMLLPFAVQAQQNKAQGNSGLSSYKCHLALEDKREVVRDYWRQPKNQSGNLERILLNQQVAVEQGRRLAIVQVLECVERDAEFTKAVARELDKQTLR
jgi:hypothetical protein